MVMRVIMEGRARQEYTLYMAATKVAMNLTPKTGWCTRVVYKKFQSRRNYG